MDFNLFFCTSCLHFRVDYQANSPVRIGRTRHRRCTAQMRMIVCLTRLKWLFRKHFSGSHNSLLASKVPSYVLLLFIEGMSGISLCRLCVALGSMLTSPLTISTGVLGWNDRRTCIWTVVVTSGRPFSLIGRIYGNSCREILTYDLFDMQFIHCIDWQYLYRCTNNLE